MPTSTLHGSTATLYSNNYDQVIVAEGVIIIYEFCSPITRSLILCYAVLRAKCALAWSVSRLHKNDFLSSDQQQVATGYADCWLPHTQGRVVFERLVQPATHEPSWRPVMTARVSQDPSDAKLSRKKHCSAMLIPGPVVSARHFTYLPCQFSFSSTLNDFLLKAQLCLTFLMTTRVASLRRVTFAFAKKGVFARVCVWAGSIWPGLHIRGSWLCGIWPRRRGKCSVTGFQFLQVYTDIQICVAAFELAYTTTANRWLCFESLCNVLDQYFSSRQTHKTATVCGCAAVCGFLTLCLSNVRLRRRRRCYRRHAPINTADSWIVCSCGCADVCLHKCSRDSSSRDMSLGTDAHKISSLCQVDDIC